MSEAYRDDDETARGPGRPGRGRGSRRGGRRHRGKLPYTTRAGDAVVVNGYSEQWLRRGFCWVYRDEVVGRTGELVPGRVVSIRSRRGAELGTGIWDDGHVEVRRFREDTGPIDADLLRERVRSARIRRPLPPETTAWRWVHGENDDLPGIRVDVWGRVLTILLDSPSLFGLLDPLVDVLTDEADVDAVYLEWRPPERGSRGEGNDAGWRELERGRIWASTRGGTPDSPVRVTERGISFLVDPARGLDAGLFCDMRDVRAWMEPHWAGRRVLNLFAYTGAFSVAAAMHGAYEVVTVDLSASHIERARANFEVNHLQLDDHQFVVDDAFQAIDRLRRAGERFDVVIADPPAFSRGPNGTWSVSKDLARLVNGALGVLAPGGWLLVASNQGSLSPRQFQKLIRDGARRANRRLRLLHQGSQPIDFAAALHFPESRYLKAWVLQA